MECARFLRDNQVTKSKALNKLADSRGAGQVLDVDHTRTIRERIGHALANIPPADSGVAERASKSRCTSIYSVLFARKCTIEAEIDKKRAEHAVPESTQAGSPNVAIADSKAPLDFSVSADSGGIMAWNK